VSVETRIHDPRHHLAVAVEANVIVGFASEVHYVHPDKPPELWINEVGVVGHSLGCREPWVLTEESRQDLG
jgi:hypothetical protein